jgi:hypothetical protein
VPSVVSAVKFGASSPNRNAMTDLLVIDFNHEEKNDLRYCLFQTECKWGSTSMSRP